MHLYSYAMYNKNFLVTIDTAAVWIAGYDKYSCGDLVKGGTGKLSKM